ncbi:MAG: RlmE family RNA methyltransferase [Candidatus Pacebacteria bacterium]|nr:RlmE family RNA methyltransferase [Candidatus Paceibacterota bacterium]
MKREFSKNDFFTKKAKQENYPARSVYKLQDIDNKFKIFRKSDWVLDLGCAPGSWLLYIGNKVSITGKVVGVDVLDLNTQPLNNTLFIKKNVLDEDLLESGPLGSASFNVVVSDMAPNTTGLLEVDVANCLELTNRALEIAKKVLTENGNFVCKVFEGLGTDAFVKEAKKYFQMVKKYRPQAVRRGSKEIYLIAKGFKNIKIL